MKHRTSELTGALLDAAVAKAMGLRFTSRGVKLSAQCHVEWLDERGVELFMPSEAWEHGGPLIEREGITTIKEKDEGIWYAGIGYWIQGGFADEYAVGPTPLIAAMRALVASKLGDEVELP